MGYGQNLNRCSIKNHEITALKAAKNIFGISLWKSSLWNHVEDTAGVTEILPITLCVLLWIGNVPVSKLS